MKQKLIANMCSFVEKYVVFLSPCLLQPFPLLINFQLFFQPHTQQPPLPSLFSTREYFTVKILPRRRKYQWFNKICYHFDVLLKKVCQRKFKFIGRIKEIDRMHFEAILLQNIFRDKETININLLRKERCYIC